MDFIRSKADNTRATLRTIFRTVKILFKADPINTVLLASGLLVQSVIPAAIIYVTKIIIDTIAEGMTSDDILPVILLWVLILALDVMINPWLSVVQGKLGEESIGHIGAATIDKATSFEGLVYFEDKKFYNDIEFIRNNTGWRPLDLVWYMLSTCRGLITSLSILILLATVAWWIPFLLIGATIPQIIIYARLKEQTYAALSMNTLPLRKMHTYRRIMTTADYAKEIRIFSLAGMLLDLYRKAFRDTFADVQRLRVKQAMWATGLLSLSIAANAYAFYYSLQQTIAGNLEIGTVLLFVQSLAVLQLQLSDLAEFAVSGLFENLLYMKRLFDFLDLEGDLPRAENPVPVPAQVQKGIRFHNMSFTYPNSEQVVLKDISFTVRPNETLAIVGENGAGKSTLIKLLARFYDPTHGQITLDDTALQDIDLDQWRQSISAVFQDFNRYPMSIHDNVMMGKRTSDTDIMQFLADVQMDDFVVDLPEKSDTMLGKEFEGTELSGGQWQKLALARAFARRDSAKVLILDEPTASLDPRSEARIFEMFARLARGCTTIMITHRLASARIADRIIVLKDGCLVEEGTHNELVQKNGEYADLWRIQSDMYKD